MRLFVPVFAIALWGVAVPARAAEAVDCPLQQLQPAHRAALKKEMQNEVDKGQYRPGWNALGHAIARCGALHKWNRAVRDLAREAVLARVEVDMIGDLIRARGTDASAVGRYLDQHPELGEVRDGHISPALLTTLRAAGIEISADAEGLVRVLVSSRLVLQQSRETFAEA
jgi:hypothetical protein